MWSFCPLSSTMELLFFFSFSVVVNCSVDLWAELAFLEMQHNVSANRRKRDCEQTNLVSCVPLHLFELQDSHSTLWWVTANVNRTFVCLQEKLRRASSDAVRWKTFFWSFLSEKLQNFLHPWLFVIWYSNLCFCQLAVSQRRTGCYFWNFELCENLSVTLNLWTRHVSAGFPHVQSERVLWSLKRTITTLSLCRFTVVPPPLWAVTRRNVIFFTAVHSVTQDFILFFSLWPKSETIFSHHAALRWAPLAAGRIISTQRQKVSQTEREQETLTERIRGENSLSWMNEGLKTMQKSCFPCSPWVIFSEQLSAFSESMIITLKKQKSCVQHLPWQNSQINRRIDEMYFKKSHVLSAGIISPTSLQDCRATCSQLEPRPTTSGKRWRRQPTAWRSVESVVTFSHQKLTVYFHNTVNYFNFHNYFHSIFYLAILQKIIMIMIIKIISVHEWS